MRKDKFITTHVTRDSYGDYEFWGKVKPKLALSKELYSWNTPKLEWDNAKKTGPHFTACEGDMHDALGYHGKRELIPMSRIHRMCVKLCIMVVTEAP